MSSPPCNGDESLGMWLETQTYLEAAINPVVAGDSDVSGEFSVDDALADINTMLAASSPTSILTANESLLKSSKKHNISNGASSPVASNLSNDASTYRHKRDGSEDGSSTTAMSQNGSGETKEAKLARGRIAARDFRARKKQMLQNLEGQVAELHEQLKQSKVEKAVLIAENTVLKQQNEFLQKLVDTHMSGGSPKEDSAQVNTRTTRKRSLLDNLSGQVKKQRAGTLLVALFGVAICFTCIDFPPLAAGPGVADTTADLGRNLLNFAPTQASGLSSLARVLILGSFSSLIGVLVGCALTNSMNKINGIDAAPATVKA